MLWEKESTRKNALHTNLFADVDITKVRSAFPNQFQSLRKKHLPKNNTTSMDYRNAGNKKFNEQKWLQAIECYNKSLSFAENKSPNIGLAYANRSACFYKLERYEVCLADIQLAKKANYPKNLMQKLDDRKANCVKYLESAKEPAVTEPKLSFKADKNIADIANTVELKHDSEFGRHFVAKCDIDVGEIVLRDEFFVSMISDERYKRCNICSKAYANLYPCARCTNALFCSAQCEKNGMHKHVCGLGEPDSSDTEDETQVTAIRSVLIATNMFRNVDEMMKFVEEAVNSPGDEMPKKLTDAKSKYPAFLKLSLNNCPSKFDDHVRAYIDYHSLVSNYGFGVVFEAKNQRRFLMHLIAHHIRILDRNSQNLIATTSDVKHFYVSIWAAYLNHSCAPNAMLFDYGNESVCMVTRPIKNGEQLFVSYFENYLDQPLVSRRMRLSKEYGFSCDCERCGTLKPMERYQRNTISSDPEFEFIKSYSNDLHKMNSIFENRKLLTSFKGKCVALLTEYGRSKWSDELAVLVGFFMNLIYMEYCKKPIKLQEKHAQSSDEEDDDDDSDNDGMHGFRYGFPFGFPFGFF